MCCPFHGQIRLHLPKLKSNKSLLIPVSSGTSVGELRQKLKIPAILLQLGLQHIRPLSDDCRPLGIQLDILASIGYESLEMRLAIGHSANFRPIFRFLIADFHGSPQSLSSSPGSSSVPLETVCLCRQDNVFLCRRWQSRKCSIPAGSQIVHIGPANEGELPEQLHMALYTLEECARKTLKLVPKSATKMPEWHLQFGDWASLHQWKERLEQAISIPPADLSGRQLLFLPADLFLLGRHCLITSLNLRRNSLQCRPPQPVEHHPKLEEHPVGWLDDVASAFPSLRHLNLADNRVQAFPNSLLLLSALTELDLSGNRLVAIPPNIRLLQNLTSLNLSNNWLLQLPQSVAKCTALIQMDLSFNRFTEIPKVLLEMPKLSCWSLAGNFIATPAFPPMRGGGALAKPKKINLRLNPLKLPRFRPIHSSLCESLTSLDIRDIGFKLVELELGALSRLQVLHCERNRIKKLALNGTALRELFATENDLDSLVVMPLPRCLAILHLGHNQLAKLPEWVTELEELITLDVQSNMLRKMPARIFLSLPCLRYLNASNNRLEYLPELVNECQLESLLLSGNRLDTLPSELFRFAPKLRSLNCCRNHLAQLPLAPSPNSSSSSLAWPIRLKELRLSFNRLSATSLHPFIGHFGHLRLLDLSHNRLRSLPSLAHLQQLEELNLSANRLQCLPACLFRLPKLHNLRAHSNLIAAVPTAMLKRAPSLKILDLSSNRLAEMPFSSSRCQLPQCLEHLDLTCNPIQQEIKENDPSSSQIVNLDGQLGNGIGGGEFSFGFSESPGQRHHLCIRQLFLKCPKAAALFALIDAGNNGNFADLVHSALENVLSEMASQMDNASAAKLALLAALERLGDAGRHLGAAVLLLGICPPSNGFFRLFCANSGHCSALLLRHSPLRPIWIANELGPIKCTLEMERLRMANAIVTEEGMINGVSPSGHAIGLTSMFPAILPDPSKFSIQTASFHCHSAVIANRHVWNSLGLCEIERLVKGSKSAQHAAKNIQDAVQANSCEENVSIIVIGLNGDVWSAREEAAANGEGGRKSHFPV